MNSSRTTRPPREAIKPATLIVPYIKTEAIRTLRNPRELSAPDGLFIRARRHPTKPGLWFSQTSTTGDVEINGPTDEGIIIFVPRAPRVGEGVFVEKVLSTGTSAKGYPVSLPEGTTYPADLTEV